jgi:hypothetical protein
MSGKTSPRLDDPAAERVGSSVSGGNVAAAATANGCVAWRCGAGLEDKRKTAGKGKGRGSGGKGGGSGKGRAARGVGGAGLRTEGSEPAWKAIEDSKVGYYLTGESDLGAVTLPDLPTSQGPTTVRVTHSNSYGRVDADIFVRIEDPVSPLGVMDFDTVPDWTKAALVEEIVWDDDEEAWVAAPKRIVGDTMWRATYDATLQFSPGQHLIEIKLVSREEAVCSIVLSNWKVRVR